MHSLLQRLQTGGRLFWGLLRELSDESPYARHLASQGLTHSPAEWRRFLDARLQRKYQRAKCC